ncbi:hypothetical protein QM480_01065 [Flectobacillus sp. DC10W]|uniref:Lipoprotein n=1 Tax=Flectobacillus longus TaxID=2984207 RepID=A0ABT6YH17_9BACT|nr:hypothetical protein [Flectobacillus longus]MDI9862896.1 hypothetical protein [Flectobacillus longus]
MKHLFAFTFILLFFTQCGSKKEPLQYFSESERDSLLTDMITYVYVPAPYANNQTKFDAIYRPFYIKSLPSFYLQNYFEADNGYAYFFMIRPVGSSPVYRRGVLGKMKLDPKTHKITEFEEIVNTPHMKEEEVREKGQFLFNKLIEKGNIQEYLGMNQYIQWPDSTLKYDKPTHTWVSVGSFTIK